MSNMGFGNSAPLPCRKQMVAYYKIVEQTLDNYIQEKGRSLALVQMAIRILQQSPNTQERLKLLTIGVLNYLDYLANWERQEAKQALATAVETCFNGFVSKVILGSNEVNNLDFQIRSQLQSEAARLDQVVAIVNQYVAPAIKEENQGGISVTNSAFGVQPRRQDGGFGANTSGGGLDFTGGFSNSNQQNSGFGNASLFSSNAEVPRGSDGGGINIGFDGKPAAQPVVTAQPVVQTQQTNKPQIKDHTVKYMNYQDHKTYGLLKSVLPSDTKRALMPPETLEQNFAAMAPTNQYKKLDSEAVTRKDFTTSPGAGYAIEHFTMTYGQDDFSSMVNEAAAEALQLGRKELERLTFTGSFFQLFPEFVDREVMDNILARYTTGLTTHGRLASMLEELEGVFRPETMLALCRKITDMANQYWKFTMGAQKGGIANYIENHDDVTDYLRVTPGKEREAQLWAEFPMKVLTTLFQTADLNQDESGSIGFGFKASYIRVPFYAKELPIGVGTEEADKFGIVLRNATPGLWNLCNTLTTGYGPVAHSLIMTNEGRLVNVIRSAVGDKEYFYIHEIKKLI